MNDMKKTYLICCIYGPFLTKTYKHFPQQFTNTMFTLLKQTYNVETNRTVYILCSMLTSVRAGIMSCQCY